MLPAIRNMLTVGHLAASRSLRDAEGGAAAVHHRAGVEDGLAGVGKLLHRHALGGVAVEQAQHVGAEDAEALAHARRQPLALPRQRLLAQQLAVHLHHSPHLENV